MDNNTTAGPPIAESVQLDNPLWHFALNLWRAPEISQLCLQLQGEGWSVTRLLCAAWLASEGHHFRGEPAEARAWRQRMTAPLRQLRQSLPKTLPATAELRQQLARAELEAERVELALAHAGLAGNFVPSDRSFRDWPLPRRLLANLNAAAPETQGPDAQAHPMIHSLSDQIARQLALPMEATP